jgi:D-tyrosyl-tRNA(Tyr) deacylase
LCYASTEEVDMRAVVQRVKRAKVTVDDEVTGAIGAGIMLLLGAGDGDTDDDMKWTLDKVLNLRIFPDDDGKMNLSLLDVDGELLVVSQFTLYGDCRKGRRPSFYSAMDPEPAEAMYDRFVECARERDVHVETGVFAAMMDVELVNDGPVTLLIDSEKNF